MEIRLIGKSKYKFTFKNQNFEIWNFILSIIYYYAIQFNYGIPRHIHSVDRISADNHICILYDNRVHNNHNCSCYHSLFPMNRCILKNIFIYSYQCFKRFITIYYRLFVHLHVNKYKYTIFEYSLSQIKEIF